jgi:sporulation and spore germination protein
VKRETIVLGAVAAVCVVLVVAAVVMRAGGGASGTERAGLTPGAAEETPAAGAEGAGGAPNAPGESAAPPAQAQAPAPTATPAATATPTETPSFISEQNRREVTLFFQEAEAESLGPEKRKIFLTSSVTDQAKQIVIELANGPLDKGLLPTLPSQTRLRGLYLDRRGTAFVDLSSDLVDFHPGGSDEEIATIFSIVDSLTYNLKEIKRVHILVNGEERDTLKSHLDLRRDYAKDMSIVDMDRKAAAP